MYHYAGFHRHHTARHYAGEAAAIERADRAETKLEKIKRKSEELTEMVVSKALIAGTSAAMGYYEGYKGAIPEVAGVGLDLIVGVGASAAALFADQMGAAKYGKYLDAVGTGSLAFYGAKQGHLMGYAKASKLAPPPAAAPAPATTAKGYGELGPASFSPHFDNVGQAPAVPYGYR